MLTHVCLSLFYNRSGAVGATRDAMPGRSGRFVRRHVRESDNVFGGEPAGGERESAVHRGRRWTHRKRFEKVYRRARRALRSLRRENEEGDHRRERED